MKILIAEDDSISRRLIEALLQKWGYDTISVDNGSDAWKLLLSDDAPRFAILDWMMPGMDGLQICRSIRARKVEPYTYVLLLTAKSQKEDIILGLEAGADDYLTKPFDPNELRARLHAGQRVLDLQAELLTVRETLKEQATHDPLTGLPNRLLFSDRLNQRLAHASNYQHQLAVMFLDLDHFKLINDTMGHEVGDLLLQAVAERLTTALRQVDTVTRMGGDEFTVILSDIEGPQDAEHIAKRILEAMSTPFALAGQEVFVSTSIGISIYPADGVDAQTLVKNADTAMYKAKELGRNNYQVYTSALNTAVIERMTLENSLRKAIERHEFLVHYQPRVDLKSGTILGMEALIRWQHPEMGLIPPDQFIPLAEDTGLILPIGEWVLYTACAQNKAWQDQGFEPMAVAVNMSAIQVLQGNLVETVKQALEKTGLAPEYLDLELTESTLMHNPDLAVGTLRELKAMGVKVAIDDFGTGYSSLSYLKKFPINTVKIDQSFVKHINSDPDDAAIAGAVVAMAHTLKLNVVAEGVETLDQLEFLRSLNCDEMQGYFISRPVPAHELTQFLMQCRRESLQKNKAAA